MKNRAGRICTGLGTALVLAALALFLWNRWEEKKAEKSVELIMPELIEYMESADASDGSDDAEPRTMLIDGYEYIGYLSVPALGLELPVMSEWDYARLKISPCRYAGAVQTDDLVIAAHNYEKHFGNLSQLAAGDALYFYDMDGVQTAYRVAEVIVLAAADVEEMTSGEYDLTLFTCTYGGKSRVTVRCLRDT